MNTMNNIVVYCGSNLGESPCYSQAARELGRAIAERGSRLVYGHEEMAHGRLTELIITDNMADRRTKMIEQADAFIALPGGLGTYEELFEVLSAAQLKLHSKPIGLLNINGFFNPITTLLQHTASQGFMPAANTGLVCTDSSIPALLNKMAAYRFQDAPKWKRPAWQEQAEAT